MPLGQCSENIIASLGLLSDQVSATLSGVLAQSFLSADILALDCKSEHREKSETF